MLNHFYKGRKWFLAIVAGALGTFTAGQAGYAQGSWTALAPVSPSPTEGMTVGGVGQVIAAREKEERLRRGVVATSE